jgi:hypothetical protein
VSMGVRGARQHKPRRVMRPPWRWIVQERITGIRDDIERIEALGELDDAARADLTTAQEHLLVAGNLCIPRGDVLDSLTRTSCDAAFRRLHAAEALVTGHLSEAERSVRVRQLLFKAEGVLDERDPVLHVPPLVDERVEHTRQLILRYRNALDDAYKQANSYRSRLLMFTGVITLFLAVLVAAAGWGVFAFQLNADYEVEFGLTPDWVFQPPRALAAAAVCTFGAVGGLLAGAGPVSRLGGVYNPSNLPWYSLLLKIQMGALCGLIGVLFVLGGFAPDIQDAFTWKDAILWGVVFGAAQQAVTRLVDRRVGAMVSTHATTENPLDDRPWSRTPR